MQSAALFSHSNLVSDDFIPTRATPGSAGYDLMAAKDAMIVGGRGTVLVPTEISVKLPPGTYGRIAMRSGLAFKQHLAVSAGVVDSDYTGTIGVLIYCTKNDHYYRINRGDRIAQLIIEKIYLDDAAVGGSADGAGVVGAMDKTGAGHDGFGSTGK